MTDKEVLPRKGHFEKVAAVKKDWIFDIRKWVEKKKLALHKQKNLGVGKVYEFEKKDDDKTIKKDDKKQQKNKNWMIQE